MEIRDTRNGSWYWVNVAVNACPHITHAEKSVYGALASFGGCKDIHPSFLIIAKRSNTTPRLAMKAVSNMTKLGLINVEKGGGRGNANVYNLLKCPAGCIKCQNSEQINSEQINSVYKDKETVNKKTINSEQKDTPIDNELDKKNKNDFTESKIPLKDKKKDMKYNPNNFEDDYENKIDFDTGEEIKPEIKKTEGRNKIAFRLQSEFIKMCKKEISHEPIYNKAGYVLLCRALKHLSEKDILDSFKDWFNEPKKDEDLIQITQALSDNRLNRWKVQNK